MKKIAFIGAGSFGFTRKLVRDILTFPAFHDAHISLMDIDPERLALIKRAVDRVVEAGDYPARVSATTDRKAALRGADGVVITILAGGVKVWRHDIEIPRKYGVDINVGDTRGPAGIFRFLRTAPVMLDILKDVGRLCPGAVVLNYTNPMAMLCKLMQVSSPVSVTGLCHSVQGTAEMLAGWIGAPMNEVTYVCAGINHQAWYLEYKWKGRDAYPLIRTAVKRPVVYREEIVRNEMFLHLDYYATESSGHNSEYNGWFRKRPDLIKKYCSGGTGWNPGAYAFILNEYLQREKTWKKEISAWLVEPTIDLVRGNEYAASIFNAIFGDGALFEFNGNLLNRGLIDNLPEGCCVELPVLASRRGLSPMKVGKLPAQLAILNNINAACEDLAVEAALDGDPRKVFHAVAMDPLTSAVLSLDEIRRMTGEMFRKHRAYLPQFRHSNWHDQAAIAALDAPSKTCKLRPWPLTFAVALVHPIHIIRGAACMILYTFIGSVCALAFALYLALSVLKMDSGTDKMKEISEAVQKGARAYLSQQYKVVGLIFIALFVVLGFLAWGAGLVSGFVPFAFISGGFFSGLAGFIGMTIATKANAKTAWAAKKSLNAGLRVAFNTGTVMGMTVVGLGLLDLTLWYGLLKYVFKLPDVDIPPIMITFGMGASTMALFARVGGGIFTKAADVGADLVGKIEAGIPEDDPRNPAVIADNVGDNVGDVAGMGADLYESYVGAIVATMALGSAAAVNRGLNPLDLIQIPMAIAGIGVLLSIVGTFFVQTKEHASQAALLSALRKGVYFSTIGIAVVSFLFIYFSPSLGPKYMGLWSAMFVGLIAGNIIAFATEYYTSDTYKPTRNLANAALTGPATIIIGGLGVGMQSLLVPVVTVGVAILAAFFLSGGTMAQPILGLYGIGMSAVGMLSTLGITLATDAYGPVADNAGGIAEMAHLEPEVRERTDALDSLGNTTAATGKGFAIGSAALTALALIAEYNQKIGEGAEILIKKGGIYAEYAKPFLKQVESGLTNPFVLACLFIGAMLPFLFSSMTMQAVGRAAQAMVEEVRRQFKADPGIMLGTSKPDYAACVAISTKGAQREMVMPSLMALFTPVIVGALVGPVGVMSLLAGSLASGFSLAVMMANAGGAWDNAKKYIERGAHGGKRSEPHKAAVVGDTVGDPFKDTAGPAMNILLKLMSMVSIVFVAADMYVNATILSWIR